VKCERDASEGHCSLICESCRVSLPVPRHHVCIVSVIFLEANETLLEHDAAVVLVVVSRQVLDVLSALPPSPSVALDLELLDGCRAEEHEHEKAAPEATVLAEVEVCVVVGQVLGTGHRQRDFVSLHEVLELD